MAMVKRDPFRDLISIQDRMNKLFDQTLSRSRNDEAAVATTWTPPVDIYETPETIVIKAELPGVAREDVDIQIHDSTLVLKGERRFAKEVQEEISLRIERTYGPFHRSFALPTTVQQDQIRAAMRNGVLEVALPKAAGAQPKRIAIDVR